MEGSVIKVGIRSRSRHERYISNSSTKTYRQEEADNLANVVELWCADWPRNNNRDKWSGPGVINRGSVDYNYSVSERSHIIQLHVPSTTSGHSTRTRIRHCHGVITSHIELWLPSTELDFGHWSLAQVMGNSIALPLCKFIAPTASMLSVGGVQQLDCWNVKDCLQLWVPPCPQSRH